MKILYRISNRRDLCTLALLFKTQKTTAAFGCISLPKARSAGQHLREVGLAQNAISLNRGLEVDAAAHDAGQRALRAAFVGFFVDMFDVYLPVVALGPAMSYFQPATLSPALKSTLFYSVLALSLVGRPVGATLFGHYGDKLGRQKVAVISMGGFAFVTLLIAFLPGYESWGITSIVVLTLLRFVDGIFLGGEYTGANPLAMEYAPKEKRGKWAAFIHAGFPLALAAMSLITTSLLRVLPAGSLHSPYVQWGWRIPFVLGALFAGGVFLYYVKKVPESKVWAKAEKTKSPLKELFQGNNFRCLMQVFLVMSGAWFTLNAVSAILPGVLLTVLHMNSVVVTNALLVANCLLALVFVPVGMLGQKIGRRTILVLIGLAGFTAGPILYYVLVRSGYRSALQLTVLVTLINLCATPVWAIVTSYINERFPTGIRATGYGIGYSAATIIPAFSSFYMLGLKGLGMPYEYTEIVIFAVGGFLLFLGALFGPETKHVELS
jgi:MFS family permease